MVYYKISGKYVMSTMISKFSGMVRVNGKNIIEGYTDNVTPPTTASRKEICGYLDKEGNPKVMLLSDCVRCSPIICAATNISTDIYTGVWFNYTEGVTIINRSIIADRVFDVRVEETDKDSDIELFNKSYRPSDLRGCNGFCAVERDDCRAITKAALAENGIK